MNHLAAALLVSAGLASVPTPAQGSPANAQLGIQLSALNQLCRNAINAGDFEEALRICRRVSFDISRLQPGSAAHIRSLIDIGDVKRAVNNFVDADAWYSAALRLSEKASGKDTAASLPLMQMIVDAKLRRGKFLEAELVLRRALAIQTRLAAPGDRALGKLRLAYADLQSMSHQFPEAERNYAKVIAQFAAAGAASADLHASAVLHLAETLEREQKFERAEAQYLLLLDLGEQQAALTPGLSPAALLGRLGYVVEQQSRDADATAYYEHELALLKASPGTDNRALIANLDARLARLRPALAADTPRR